MDGEQRYLGCSLYAQGLGALVRSYLAFVITIRINDHYMGWRLCGSYLISPEVFHQGIRGSAGLERRNPNVM